MATEAEEIRGSKAPKCSAEGCHDVARARGLCGKHYQRLRKNGDPLKTRSTPNGDAQAYYEQVVLAYEGDDCLAWPYARSVGGYGRIWRGGKLLFVSRCLCEDVNGPPPDPTYDAAHSCGKGHLGCVTKRHLSWKTPAENNADKILHDTHIRGSRNVSSKLTEAQVRAVLELRGVESQRSIADRYGVSHQLISQIQCGQRWAWISPSHVHEGISR